MENLDFDAEFEAIMSQSMMEDVIEKGFQEWEQQVADLRNSKNAEFRKAINHYNMILQQVCGGNTSNERVPETVINRVNINKVYTDINFTENSIGGPQVIFYNCKFENFNGAGAEMAIFINCEFSGSSASGLDGSTDIQQLAMQPIFNGQLERAFDQDHISDMEDLTSQIEIMSQSANPATATPSGVMMVLAYQR